MKKNSFPTLKFSGKKRQPLTWALAACALVVTSCSNEDMVENPAETELQQVDLQTLTLVDAPEELMVIREEENSDQMARATEAPGVDRGRFNIRLDYVVPVTERQQQVFEEAAAGWERIIIGDVPSFTGDLPSAFIGLPPISGTVDDVVIEVALAPIDGPGSILGQAGPRFVRTEDFLTLSGVMFFDVDDLAFLESIDLFEEVIVHEMGHVLGVGTLWNVNRPDLGIQRNLLTGTFAEPYFAGKKANVFWNAEGGANELPIENMGGGGTRFSHWRESQMRNELMTGFLNLGENPLSRITAGSMRDLGYRSSSVGETYDLPEGSQGVDPGALGGTTDSGLNIADSETLLSPIGVVVLSKQ